MGTGSGAKQSKRRAFYPMEIKINGCDFSPGRLFCAVVAGAQWNINNWYVVTKVGFFKNYRPSRRESVLMVDLGPTRRTMPVEGVCGKTTFLAAITRAYYVPFRQPCHAAPSGSLWHALLPLHLVVIH